MAARFPGGAPPVQAGPAPQRYPPPQPQRPYAPPPFVRAPPGPAPRPGYGPPQPRAAPKRPPDARSPLPGKPPYDPPSKRKKRLADKILPQKVRDLVPESQAYMDLLAFERKLDATILRKRLDIQEALKRPMKQKRKLRIFISNTFYPGQGEGGVASWELRVEGRLLDDARTEPNKVKRKFSSFFKSLVIELDKELYGPDNHLVEWHRTLTTQETDGFQVKRPGYKNVRCTILLLLDYQPLQFKLDPRLARLLGVHTQARPVVVNALWQYIRTHRLQDPNEREYVLCDKYLEQVFGCSRLKLAEVPARLAALLHAPDPIVINHVIAVEPPHDAKQTACYDIDVEVDDSLKAQMNSFLLSTANQQEIQGLDAKIHETVDTIHQLKTNREFFLSFGAEPQRFVQRWLQSQARDLKTLGGGPGGSEEERRGGFYMQEWCGEAAQRYLSGRVGQRRRELDAALLRGAGWLHQRWRALVAECLGTALLVLLGCATVRPHAALTEPALGWGCVVAALATALGPISGAHMNPAVTLGATITRHLPPTTAVAYVASQCVGGLLGYGLLWILVPNAYAVTMPTEGVHALKAAGVEAIMTGTLVLVVCAVCAGPHDASAPIKVGLTIAALVYVGGPLTGTSLNPARSLAPALIHWQWSSHWVYWLGPLGGAALAASAYRWLLTPPPSKDETDPSPGPALPLLDKHPAPVA